MWHGRWGYVASLVFVGMVTAWTCKPERPTLDRTTFRGITSGASEGDDPVVAEIAGYPVHLSEVRDQIEDLPVFNRIRYQSPEARRQFLEAWIQFLALTWAARQEGLERDPEVVDALKSEMVVRYLREQVDPLVTTTDIPEEWVRAYYDQHRHEFVRPEQREVRQVVIRDPERARRIAFRAKKRTSQPGVDPVEEFTRIVRTHSEDPRARATDGVIGRYPWADPEDPPVPEHVVSAASRMRELFEVSDPVASPEGFHILFVSKVFPATNLGVEEARLTIVERLLERERNRVRGERVREVLARADVRVDESVVARVQSQLRKGQSPEEKGR